MARMPKCSGCQNCDPIKVTCIKYKEGIPKDILIELKLCKYYIEEESEEDYSEDVIIAKGR